MEGEKKRRSLVPGRYDWIVCDFCGAKHGYRPEKCQSCRMDLTDSKGKRKNGSNLGSNAR